MQKALRNQIEQLEPGLTIIVSKSVEPEKLLEVVSRRGAMRRTTRLIRLAARGRSATAESRRRFQKS